MSDEESNSAVLDLVQQIAEQAIRDDRTVAVAESLTGGQLAATLAAGPYSSIWFRGGLVAYQPQVKFDLLGVTPGPVVNAETAIQMASGVHKLFRPDFAVAVTGVGGPGPEEGCPFGTVYLAVARSSGEPILGEYEINGDSKRVVQITIEQALIALQIEMGRLNLY